jgi:hypothetical protein
MTHGYIFHRKNQPHQTNPNWPNSNSHNSNAIPVPAVDTAYIRNNSIELLILLLHSCSYSCQDISGFKRVDRPLSFPFFRRHHRFGVAVLAHFGEQNVSSNFSKPQSRIPCPQAAHCNAAAAFFAAWACSCFFSSTCIRSSAFLDFCRSFARFRFAAALAFF